jgi:cytochrome c-type biogenesis protein CcmH/NrfF
MRMLTMRKTVQILWIVTASAMLLAAGDQEARFQTLGHKMMCRCGCNQILLECNHVGCTYSDKMRNELVAAINGPDSDDLILQGFVQSYGAVVLAAPTTTGFNRLAWITPFAALLLGMTAVVYVVKRWQHHAPQTAPTGAAPADPELDEFRDKARQETEL